MSILCFSLRSYYPQIALIFADYFEGCYNDIKIIAIFQWNLQKRIIIVASISLIFTLFSNKKQFNKTVGNQPKIAYFNFYQRLPPNSEMVCSF
jgi:hypothetical protein